MTPATMTNTTSATMFSPLAIVSVYCGSTKNQFASADAPMAATRLTIRPPRAATAMTNVSNTSRLVANDERSSRATRTAVSSGSPTRVSAHADA